MNKQALVVRAARNGRGINLNPNNNTCKKYRRSMSTDRINHVRGVMGMRRAEAVAFLRNINN